MRLRFEARVSILVPFALRRMVYGMGKRRCERKDAVVGKNGGLLGKLFGGRRGKGESPELAARAQDLLFPDAYQLLDALPDDAEGSLHYAMRSDSGAAFIAVEEVSRKDAMPFGQPGQVIAGIHRALGIDQGLIEVEGGSCPSGVRWIESIVKTSCEPSGVQYCLTLHLEREYGALQVQGFFEELGVTGMRDAAVFSQMRGRAELGSDLEGWMCDPYDPKRTAGLLMNRSELRKYDAMFPGHPLSMARALVAQLTA